MLSSVPACREFLAAQMVGHKFSFTSLGARLFFCALLETLLMRIGAF